MFGIRRKTRQRSDTGPINQFAQPRPSRQPLVLEWFEMHIEVTVRQLSLPSADGSGKNLPATVRNSAPIGPLGLCKASRLPTDASRIRRPRPARQINQGPKSCTR